MIVTGQNIIGREFLMGADPSKLKGASYYLRIHCIIPAGEDAQTFDHADPISSYTLKPGGLAWIISEEVFSISDHRVTALVTLRSNFTKQGMLALDVGLVDANYHGPIGSIVINFSKNDIHLSKGEEFFRVIFFEHGEVEEKFRYPEKEFNHETYINQQLKSLISDFPTSFMQADQMEERLATDVEKKVVDKVQEGLFDKVVLALFKKHWLKLAIALGLFGAAVIAFDRLFLPSILSEERQKYVVCQMVKDGTLTQDSVPDELCK